jgi:hypothetical protein
MRRKVDDQICALARRKLHLRNRNRSRQQSLIGADLMDLDSLRQRHPIVAAIRTVQNAESIPARLHIEIRKYFAVDEWHLT